MGHDSSRRSLADDGVRTLEAFADVPALLLARDGAVRGLTAKLAESLARLGVAPPTSLPGFIADGPGASAADIIGLAFAADEPWRVTPRLRASGQLVALSGHGRAADTDGDTLVTCTIAWPSTVSAPTPIGELIGHAPDDEVHGSWLRAAFDNASIGRAFVATDGRVIRANGRLAELLGRTPEALVGRTVVELTHPDDRHRTACELSKMRAAGDSLRFEKRCLRADGSHFWSEISTTAFRAAPDAPMLFMTDVYPIDDRKARERAQAEQAEALEQLRQSEARVRVMFDHFPMPILLWTLDGSGHFALQDCNAAAAASFEARAGIVGQEVGQLALVGSGVEDALLRALQTGAIVDREGPWPFIGGGRAERLVAMRFVALPPERVLMYCEEVTERRHTEAQLRLTHKLEAVGRLAGGISHDFNNLLTVIGTYARVCLEQVDPSDGIGEDLREILAATDRASALTRQLLAFSRRQLLKPVVLSVNEVVAELHKMLRRVLGEDIDLSLTLGESVGNVRFDPGQLEQVIMNLAVNARDAMPRGGALSLRTSVVELDGSYADERPGVTPGRYVLLTVSDSGHGMDAETSARALEPFFTTKRKGEGTGLGLATVYGIVKQSGGNVWLYSEPGVGTTVKVYIPQVDAAPALRVERPPATAISGHETVLVVEDEAGVRRSAERVLRGAGYRVLTARGGDDALRIIAGLERPVDLVLTDVIMPGMSGPELGSRLRSMAAPMRVLYMSGYTDDMVLQHGLFDHGEALVEKPFSGPDLLRHVREALDRVAHG